ncbi:MAG: LacI family DNA-binding transcriptional regulator [Marinomonas sp.]
MARNSVTLEDIARQLGIHVSTVSRVLNGSAGGVRKAASAATVERIYNLAKEKGYQPNPHAITLRTQQSREIAVLVPRLSDPVMATVYESIDIAADQSGYTAFVSNTFGDFERQREFGERAVARSVGGIIIADSVLDPAADWLEKLSDYNIPYVLVVRSRGEHVAVTCDDYLGGRMAAEHLWKQGHRQVALLGGDLLSSTGADRSRGFLSYFSEKGLPIRPTLIRTGLFDIITGRQQTKEILQTGIEFSALFAVNDLLAVGAMASLREEGLEPGKDVAVIGYNNTSLASQITPALTSISSDMELQGQKAVEMLLQKIAGETPQNYLVSPQLHIRDSSNFQRK